MSGYDRAIKFINDQQTFILSFDIYNAKMKKLLSS